MKPLFITGIGTDVGKTVAAAIVTEALGAVYWKPVQAGFAEGTDSEWVAARLSAPKIAAEAYRLAMPASPHIAAREEGIAIDLDRIVSKMPAERPLVIEGAGGLMVPLNDNAFVLDLVKKLDARVLLISRNYLGSINHSLLTAAVCRQHGLDVAGWLFNDQYLDYEQEIGSWTGLPVIGSIPFSNDTGPAFVAGQAALIRRQLMLIASA